MSDQWSFWITAIGAVASIGGAGVAIIQASRAKSHASAAEKLHSDMIVQRQVKEVAAVHTETTRILRVVAKVGPSCTKSGIRGLKASDIAQQVEEFARFLMEHSQHFDQFLQNEAEKLCRDLRPLIEKLSEAQEFPTIKDSGKQIYDAIHEFLPRVKQLSDSKSDDALRA
jgi:hypothetical protein